MMAAGAGLHEFLVTDCLPGSFKHMKANLKLASLRYAVNAIGYCTQRFKGTVLLSFLGAMLLSKIQKDTSARDQWQQKL